MLFVSTNIFEKIPYINLNFDFLCAHEKQNDGISMGNSPGLKNKRVFWNSSQKQRN